jgi:hypothetical protein
MAFWHVVQTFFYPRIFFITLLNSIMINTALGAAYTVAPTILTAPYNWPFLHLGLCLVVVIIASIGTYVIAGFGADKFANWLAKRAG